MYGLEDEEEPMQADELAEEAEIDEADAWCVQGGNQGQMAHRAGPADALGSGRCRSPPPLPAACRPCAACSPWPPLCLLAAASRHAAVCGSGKEQDPVRCPRRALPPACRAPRLNRCLCRVLTCLLALLCLLPGTRCGAGP